MRSARKSGDRRERSTVEMRAARRQKRRERRLLGEYFQQPLDTSPLVKYCNIGGDVNVRLHGNTALCAACQFNAVHAVQYLVTKAGADVELTNRDGFSPLELALSTEHVECVQILLRGGADPNCRSHSGDTLLSLAVRSGNERCVAALIGSGAAVNLDVPKFRAGTSLICYALFTRCNLKIAKLLVRAGTLPHRFLSPFDYILLQDPRFSLKFLSLLSAAGFDILCPGWLDRMRRLGRPALTERQGTILDWIVSVRSQPAPLMHLSRVAIRMHLGRMESTSGGESFLDRIRRLPLPRALLCYLALETFNL